MHKVMIAPCRTLVVLLSIAGLVVAAEEEHLLASNHSTYCAFEVTVRDRRGTPLANIPVTLALRDNRVVTVLTDSRGLAKLCDSPLAQVDIAVGSSRCGLVLVKNLTPRWPTPRRVYVKYARTECGDWLFSTACQVLVRIDSSHREPLSGVLFRDGNDKQPIRNDVVSDSYGRLFFSVKRGDAVRGVVSKPGFQSSDVSVQCDPAGPEHIERTVLLDRVEKAP